jgi:hypothetical protein
MLSFNLRVLDYLPKSEIAIKIAHSIFLEGECSGCEAAILRHQAQLLHFRAYKSRDQRLWDKAGELIKCSVSIGRAATETDHDIESGGVAPSLSCLAEILYHSGHPARAIACASEALGLITTRRAPELYDLTVFNLAVYLKSCGGKEHLLVVEAAIIGMRSKFKGHTRLDYFKARLDWLEAQVRWELQRAPVGRVWELVDRARECFRKKGMRIEYVAITADLGRMRLAERGVVIALVEDLIRTEGLPLDIRMAVGAVSRAVAKGTWDGEFELIEALRKLRNTTAGGAVLPAFITY